MKNRLCVVFLFILMLTAAGCTSKNPLNPENPVTITVWNYYSGYQQVAFDEMMTEFNQTVGMEQGIILMSVAQGSIEGLLDELYKSLEAKSGAQDIPDMVCIYADTARKLDEMGVLLSLDDYFSDKEQEEFVPSFLEEGRLTEGGEIKLIPISKSTEIMLYNKTDFDNFAAQADVKAEDMLTMEGLAEVAKTYYIWSDNKTPDIQEDGKAFFGRDSMGNYFMGGLNQLGQPAMSSGEDGEGQCSIDRDALYTLWKNYYIPYINGYYAAFGRFRSDDAKIGKIVATVGSSSGVSFFPTSVTREDDTAYEIEIGIMNAPVFKDGNGMVLQQGASFGVLKSDEAKQYAAVKFLKWMTEKNQNIKFSLDANYMPVTKSALAEEAWNQYFEQEENVSEKELLRESLRITSLLVLQNKLWTDKPFEQSGEIRAYLAAMMEDIAKTDREAVLALMEQGKSRQEAVAPYEADEYFENWYDEVCSGVQIIMTGE